jgi:hypothetical protein
VSGTRDGLRVTSYNGKGSEGKEFLHTIRLVFLTP